MARLTNAFDSRNHVREEPTGDFAPLPDGWYRLKVAKTELLENQARTGTYIKLRLDVVGPTHQGRVLFANITNDHVSKMAERIGRDQLDVFCKAGGIDILDDSDLLLGVVVEGQVTQSEYQGKKGNELKKYRVPADAAAKPAAMSFSAPKASAGQETFSAPASSKPPWAR
jgi:hypothetical protein